MAGEAVQSLEGLPKLLAGFADAVAKMDEGMATSGLKTILKMAKAGPALAQDLGLSADQVMEIINLLVARTMRIGAAEILVRGDVSVRTSLEVAGALQVGFQPWVSFEASGGYARQTGEHWGSEIRLSMAALPPDNQIIADFIQRFQERGAVPDPSAIDFIRDLLPEIQELFGTNEGGDTD